MIKSKINELAFFTHTIFSILLDREVTLMLEALPIHLCFNLLVFIFFIYCNLHEPSHSTELVGGLELCLSMAAGTFQLTAGLGQGKDTVDATRRSCYPQLSVLSSCL